MARQGEPIGGATDGSGRNTVWDGQVFLETDFVVLAGDTLTIAAGTTVLLATSSQADTASGTAGKVDLIVGGTLLVGGESDNPVRIESTATWARGAADWGGITFVSGAGPGSRLEYAEIRNAQIAVRADSVAPALAHVRFEDNGLADIFLEKDTRVPSGTAWLLRAPTRLVAFADYSLWDDPLGNADLCDLIVLGELVTERPPGMHPDSLVIFESTARDSVNAKDWGGITVAAGGRGLLHDCDIGFTVRGVYFAAADSAVLVDSKVHHYREEGVFDYASDALIQGCTIERGDGLLETVETTAIRASSSVPTIDDNEIGWQTDYGIWASFASSWCEKSLPFAPEDTVRIVRNTITGDNGEADREGSAAIRGEYLCQHHAAAIDTNTVTNWQGRAVDLYQSADVRLSCNTLVDNYRAGVYYRDTEVLQSFEGDVYWKQNALKRSYRDNLLVNGLEALVVYDAAGSGAAAGKNSFQRKVDDDPNMWNIRLDVKGVADTLDARHQAWLHPDSTIIAYADSARATNSPGANRVILVEPLLSSEQLCSLGSSARRGAGQVVLDGERPEVGATDVLEGAVLPDRWGLELTGPNPSRGPVKVSLAVRDPATVRVSVYDVRGRRVRVLQEGALRPGFYEVTWDRSAEGGDRVAAGVYFLRMEGGDFRGTRKIVLLPLGQ